jgi:hypothetical protein
VSKSHLSPLTTPRTIENARPKLRSRLGHLSGVITFLVANISARYDTATDTLWVCVERVLSAQERQAKREWVTFEAYMQSDLPAQPWMEPVDIWNQEDGDGNDCFENGVVSRDNIISLWQQQGF